MRVAVYRIDLGGGGDGSLLSADERERAARLRVPGAGERFIAGRAALRKILGQITGHAPEKLIFGVGEHGKPYLTNMPDAPHFNLTHSENLALLAVADAPVGVDVERIRPLSALADMAATAFTETERTALDALDEAERLTAFFRVWTRKEAIAKADGAGFRIVKTFDVPILATSATPRQSELLRIQIGDFALCDLPAPEGFAAALAVRAPESATLDIVTAP